MAGEFHGCDFPEGSAGHSENVDPPLDGRARRRSNPDRAEAFSLVRMASDVQGAVDLWKHARDERPVLLGTSARDNGVMTPQAVRDLLADRPVLLLFGTGHGMAPEILDACDGILRPLRWMDAYNHLPVRGRSPLPLIGCSATAVRASSRPRLCGTVQCSVLIPPRPTGRESVSDSPFRESLTNEAT